MCTWQVCWHTPVISVIVSLKAAQPTQNVLDQLQLHCETLSHLKKKKEKKEESQIDRDRKKKRKPQTHKTLYIYNANAMQGYSDQFY